MWITGRKGKEWLQKREKGRKSAQKGGKTGKGRCGKRVDERCGTVWKKRGDVEKKTGRSERRYGEREKKKDGKGEFHRNIHNVEKTFPGYRHFYMP